MEKVDVKSLTHAQKDCFLATLSLLGDTLIPSVLHVINSSFYYEGLKTSPQEICDMLVECVNNLKSRKLKPERQFLRPRGQLDPPQSGDPRGKGRTSSVDEFSFVR